MTSFLEFLQGIPAQIDGSDMPTILGILAGLAAVVTVLGSVIKTLAGVIGATGAKKSKALEGEKAKKELPSSATTADIAVQTAMIEATVEGTDELLRLAREGELSSVRSLDELKRLRDRLSAQARLIKSLRRDQERQQRYLEDLSRGVEEIRRTALVSAEVTRALHALITAEVQSRAGSLPLSPVGLLEHGDQRGPKSRE